LETSISSSQKRHCRHAKIVTAEGNNFKIEAWDYRYYSEKVRKEKYDYNQDEVKQYLQLDKIRDGMFWVAGELFNLKFTPINNVPVYHPDVKAWEVSNKTTGKPVGYGILTLILETENDLEDG